MPLITDVLWGFDSWADPLKRPKCNGSALRCKTGFSFSVWRNAGYEQTYSQPVHHWYKSPPTGDQGIEAPFVFVPPPPTPPYFYDLSWVVRYKVRYMPEFGDQGIAAPYVFVPPIIPPEPPIPTPPLDPAQYGPSFRMDNLIMRRDDKPNYTYWPDPFTVPGKGRGD